MQYKLPITLLALSMLTIGSISTQAQTVATFDDVTLPGADTTYLESVTGPDGVYTYQSGNAKFYGKKDFGGTYQSNFNCSNHTDTVTPGFVNMWSNITGKGVLSSSNFGIAYVETDYSLATYPTIPVSVKLTGGASGHQVEGAYFTNSVYAYRYMLNSNFYDNGNHWFKLIIRGYLNNTQSTDSVIFTLADYSTAGTPVLVNTWQWVSLMSLGNVDSLTFDLISSDAGASGVNTPTYFAIDNLTTLDGVCPVAQNIAAVSVNENSATINWQNSISGFTTNYEVAVDQSATLAPTATAVTVSNSTYNATSLSNNTVYYAHVRSACSDGGFSAWDTATFKTLQGTGIFQTNPNNLQLSISPNPATDYITLHTGIAVHAVVYSIEGKELLQVNNAKTINISSLPTGVYLLKVTDATGSGKQTTLRFTKN
ncbi:MAG: DUF4465 domain-containing protein [Taibaiella sp.]|jgi:hypothetical protein